MRKIWFQLIADLLVNLAAGWIGAMIVVSIFFESGKINILVLTMDLLMGILCLVIAWRLKRIRRRKNGI